MITDEKLNAARSAPLGEFLLAAHPNQVKLIGTSVVLIEHPKVSTRLDFNGYLDWKTGETGDSIDLLMRYLGYSFAGAVDALASYSPQVMSDSMHTVPSVKTGAADLTPYTSPQHYSNNDRVLEYLKSRGIPEALSTYLIQQGLLYEDKHNNVVFENETKNYYEIRGTYVIGERRCKNREKCELYESHKCDNGWCSKDSTCDRYKKSVFRQKSPNSAGKYWLFNNYTDKNRIDKVYVCEAAIDAISLYVLQALRGIFVPAAYASIGGVANTASIVALQKKYGEVILAVDNDEAGVICRQRFAELESELSDSKDWNDDLFIKIGEKSIDN